MRWHPIIAVPLLAIVVLSGCVGTGSKEFETVVTDMHQRVSTLDRDLEGSVTELNEQTAALIARVNENERQVRLLQSLMEENRHKIEKLLGMLHDLKTTLYRHWGLDPGPAPGDVRRPGAGSGVTIEPPKRPVSSSSGTGSPATGPPPPTEPPPEASAPAISDEAAYANAKELYDQEDYGAARLAFSAFLREFPNSERRHQAQFWVGKCHLSESEYTRAIEAFEALRREYPDSAYMAFALHNQAVAHFRRGERDKAVGLMEEVVANYPTSTAADHARRDLEQLRGR